jgi:hypothetical protein
MRPIIGTCAPTITPAINATAMTGSQNMPVVIQEACHLATY